jgi:hypothetical protein
MSISQGTDVKHQPRPDCQAPPETNNQSLARSLTTFSTSSRRPQGADARRHRRTGRAAPTPLRSAPGAALGLARTRQRVPPETVEVVKRQHPEGARFGRLPASVAQAACRMIERWGLRIAPLAIMGVQSGTARVKGGLRPSQAIASRPLTRTAPNLRSAAIGAMRRTDRAS